MSGFELAKIGCEFGGGNPSPNLVNIWSEIGRNWLKIWLIWQEKLQTNSRWRLAEIWSEIDREFGRGKPQTNLGWELVGIWLEIGQKWSHLPNLVSKVVTLPWALFGCVDIFIFFFYGFGYCVTSPIGRAKIPFLARSNIGEKFGRQLVGNWRSNWRQEVSSFGRQIG